MWAMFLFEKLYAIQIRYAPVQMFLHRHETQMAKFCQIETVDGRILKLTDRHLIYVSHSCDPIANVCHRIVYFKKKYYYSFL